MSKPSSYFLPIAIALVSLAVSAYAGYSVNDKSIAQRITAVEVQQSNDKDRLVRIENKLDELARRLEEFMRERRR
jgi:hypothetical protein